jgi:hypothetical protein
MMSRPIIGVLLAICSYSLPAADALRVEAMNYPAWVVRNYETLPLLPGLRLGADDLLRTGKGGRLLLRMADGSAVKLGESARFLVNSAVQETEAGNAALESVFQVLRGAFRFTAGVYAARRTGHRVSIRIGAITAGIRGTDIWGRSNAEQDLVCLIDGSIRVQAEGENGLDLDQPLSVYVKPKEQSPRPVEPVDMPQLQRWAAETELDPGAGKVVGGGQWQVVLISLTSLKNAEKLLLDYRQRGFAAQRKSVIRQGRTLHRVLLPGFESIEDAVNEAARMENLLGISNAWVWRAN